MKLFNEAYEAKGIPMRKIEKAGTWYFHKFLPTLFSKRMMLSITCAIEHGTAQIAEFAFANPEGFDHLDESARDFLLWHLLEETEHKSVAFDLYQQTVGSHYLRVAGWYAIHFFTIFMFIYSFVLILRSPGYWPKNEDGSRVKFRAILENAKQNQARPPVRTRSGRRRKSRKMYFHKKFHPNYSGKTELFNHWQEKLFGENGTLNQYVTKSVLPQ